jgi:hypothetical protein
MRIEPARRHGAFDPRWAGFLAVPVKVPAAPATVAEAAAKEDAE